MLDKRRRWYLWNMLSAGRGDAGSGPNLLVQPANLSSAPWVPEGLTVTAAGSDWKLAEDATTGPHRLNQSIALADSADHILSVDATAVERSWLSLGLSNKASATQRGWFNLATGVVGTQNATLASGITALGGGTFRCWVRVNTATGGATPAVRIGLATADAIVSYAGTIGSGVLARNPTLVRA